MEKRNTLIDVKLNWGSVNIKLVSETSTYNGKNSFPCVLFNKIKQVVKKSD